MGKPRQKAGFSHLNSDFNKALFERFIHQQIELNLLNINAI